MGNVKKIDDDIMVRMIQEGKSHTEVAKRFNVTKQAVQERFSKLKKKILMAVNADNAHRVVQKELNAMDQLQMINAKAIQLLDVALEAPKSDDDKPNNYDPSLALKAMKEIRGQLKLQMDLFQSLYNVRSAAEFQQKVIELMEEVSPELKERFIRKLKAERTLRRLVG
jgi:transposase